MQPDRHVPPNRGAALTPPAAIAYSSQPGQKILTHAHNPVMWDIQLVFKSAAATVPVNSSKTFKRSKFSPEFYEVIP
jgi:hypothetical protein